MNQSLTITGYAGVPFQKVVAELGGATAAHIERAVRQSEERVSNGLAADVIVERSGINQVTVRVASPSAELDGAVVTVAPVGDAVSGVTELTIRLGRPFETGERGSRQFLAASTFVWAATLALKEQRRAA